MESMVERFVRYTSINTRSNEESTTIPSTQTQVDFATNVLVPDLKAIGLDEVIYNRENGFVIGTLNANTDEKAPAIGFIAHMDTADYNAENIKPRIVENYDGSDICLNEEHQIYTRRADFPNLKNYIGKSLVVTDGLTLLGGDDKAGICEIMEALAYLVAHPEIKHGKIMCAFGPDEEIGTGADHFDVKQFPVDFAYTIDGGDFFVREVYYKDMKSYQSVLKFIFNHNTQCKTVTINTGVDDRLMDILDNPKDASFTIKPFMMARIVDIENFLRDLEIKTGQEGHSLNIEISDPVIRENNGIYSFDNNTGILRARKHGNAVTDLYGLAENTMLGDDGAVLERLVEDPPDIDISLTINELTSLLFAYRTIEDICFIKGIDVSDSLRAIFDFKKKTNYINEYV